MYKIIRACLFLFNPEKVHYFSMNCLRLWCSIPFGMSILATVFKPVKTNPVQFCGLNFQNPVGLGAGFDKNARYLSELEALGFGFVEIGTVTPLPQDGNEKPRLFRLPQDKALINRMGFNNDGMEKIALRLKEWRKKNPQTGLIIGGNIGKNKNTPNEEAWKDYEKCFLALYAHADYFVVNVSSPNTPGLRALQDKDSLKKIFTVLHTRNSEMPVRKPILLKIAPDLEKEQVDDVISLALEIKLDGLIVSNTSISRENLITPVNEINKIGAGGLSGKPITQKSTQMIGYIYKATNGQVPLIGSGGIFTGADAWEKINAGASLVQVWTGFIYEGPMIVKRISAYLAARIK